MSSKVWERKQWGENRELGEKASFFETTSQGKSTDHEQGKAMDSYRVS